MAATLCKDDIRRAAGAEDRHPLCRCRHLRWRLGLDRGCCLMIGGEKAAVDHLGPIFTALAPGKGMISRKRPSRGSLDPRAEQGYIHGSGGRRALRQDGPGNEYGAVRAYAEGFNILESKNAEVHRRANASGSSIADIAEVWRRPVRWSPPGCSTSRPSRSPRTPRLEAFSGHVAGPARALDSGSGDRGSRARRVLTAALFTPLPLPPELLRRENAVPSDAARLRRAQGRAELGRFTESRSPGPFLECGGSCIPSPLRGEASGIGLKVSGTWVRSRLLSERVWHRLPLNRRFAPPSPLRRREKFEHWAMSTNS